MLSQLTRVHTKKACRILVNSKSARTYTSTTTNLSKKTSSTVAASTQRLHDTLGASHEAAHDLAPRLGRAQRLKSSMAAAAAPATNAAALGGLDALNQDGATSTSRSNFEDWMVNLRGNEHDAWLHGPRDTNTWYTGKRPVLGECPGVGSDGKLRSLPLPNLSKVTRQSTLDYYDNSWTLMETMFSGLKGEEPFYRPPIHGLRHPQIFYYGHTPCLYVNKLRVAGVLSAPVDAYLESIMETGVDEMLWDDMHKNDMVWPTVKEVHEYRKKVYSVVRKAIEEHPSLSDDTEEIIGRSHPLWSLFMGFEHERIHLETSSVLFRETPKHLVQVPEEWPPLHPSSDHDHGTNTNPVEGVDYPLNEMVAVNAGTVELGKPSDFPSYGWDNEYGHRTMEVPSFSASKHLITNGEYFEFVKSGGYRDSGKKYWSEDGWGWKQYRNAKNPFFWDLDGPTGSHQYKLRTIFETLDNVPWNWPVDVNYHESIAYCNWKNEQSNNDDEASDHDGDFRVITEAEHHLIRDDSISLDAVRLEPELDRVLKWSGSDFASETNVPGAANLNLAYGSQSPVDALMPSMTGHHDTMGNAWEWTEDHFNPLNEFEAHEYYDDFSTPCFDGRHHMIAGGSFISTGDEASVFARFHFRPHFLQHSSFRLVQSNQQTPSTTLMFEDGTSSGNGGASTSSDAAAAAANDGAVVRTSSAVGGDAASAIASDADVDIYETKALVDQYLGLHFPSSGMEEGVSAILEHNGAPIHALEFPQRVAQLAAELRGNERSTGRALDIGCAVGGSSFELAASGFNDVVGFDYSQSFVDAANDMKNNKDLTFRVPLEAETYTEVSAMHQHNVNEEVRNRCTFQTGDACNLVNDFNNGTLGTDQFDAAILANLLCRLPDPIACLDGLEKCIAKDGIAVIVTPFSWLEQFTHKSKWLGGYDDPVSGTPIDSYDRLRAEMETRGFEQVHHEQMPLVIREHRRKYQYIVSEATGWRKK